MEFYSPDDDIFYPEHQSFWTEDTVDTDLAEEGEPVQQRHLVERQLQGRETGAPDQHDPNSEW